MQTKDLLITGLFGGMISAIFYPIVTFFIPRLVNKWMINIAFDISENFKSLRITNSSFSTLQNVIVYVTIDNTKNDIIIHPNFKVFSNEQILEDRLSWSKNIDGKNQSEININQGESQKLNLLNVNTDFIEVASEQGFYTGSNSSRILLRPDRDYKLQIKITGDNFFFKKMTIHYNHNLKQIQS